MCGYEICLYTKQFQTTLNAWGKRYVSSKYRYKYVVFLKKNYGIQS